MTGKILLIGGNGFIGRALARKLAGHGHPVTILSRHRPSDDMAGVDWEQGNLDDAALLGTLLRECQSVVHLATTSTPSLNALAPAREAQENLLPLLRLLEVMSGHPNIPLVYLSSGGAIYGNPAFLPVDETHPLAPLSHHAAGKAAAEQFLGVFARQGHRISILRPANVYGPGQALQTGFGIVRHVLEHLWQGTPMTIWGDGETARDYLYIDDMINACEAVLDNPGTGTFNLGSGTALSLKQLCGLAEDVTGRRLDLRYEPARGVDVRSVALDSSSFILNYGWQPKTAIDEGLSLTWKWLLTRP
jgi:UDP-glucose 4-epimerase